MDILEPSEALELVEAFIEFDANTRNKLLAIVRGMNKPKPSSRSAIAETQRVNASELRGEA